MAGDMDIVGTAGVDVVPVAPNFHNKLKAIVLPAADRVGEQAGRRLGDAMSDHIVVAIPNAINRGGQAARVAAGRQGDNAGGAFATSLRRKLEVAFKAMPKLDVRLSDTGVDAELARLRAKLEQLSNKRIGVDITTADAEAQVQRLDDELKRLGANHPNPRIRIDTAAARAALKEFREEIAAATALPGTVHLEVDGSFGAKMRAAVAEAQASLPNINVTADTSDARAELQSLRTQMATLSEKRIGIDIDAADARAQIADIRRRLGILSVQRNDIDVRVDAARAEAQLAALDAQADKVKLVNIKAFADTSQAQSALMNLGIQMAILTAIPLVPILAAGIGAIASAATAAGAGVGVVALAAIPAIKGVTEAIQAKSAAEKQATTATDNSAAANVRASQRALQMESATQALASAHRQAAQQIAQANRQVEDAERAVADAAQRASDQRRQAADSVARAERSLVDAQKAAKAAQLDLTQARKDAAQELEDYNTKLTDGALDQRDATLRVQEAQKELASTQAKYDIGRATDLDLERSQLSYDQAVQAAKEQKDNYSKLQKEAKAAAKAGVDGNSNVKRAADQLAKAQRDVQDQTKAVADAHRAAARVEVEAAQSVADAQRSLSDAVKNAANTQVQAAESIRSAERGVESARLSSLDTTAQAVTKQDELRKALAKLTPEQRKLYDSLAGPKGLTAAFKAWSKELQPDVLPIFVRGVDSAKRTLPGLSPLVRTAADAIGDLQDSASAEVKNPFWQGFKKDIEKSAKPAIVGLGKSFGYVLKGMAGVVDAFLPHMDGISATMQRITRRFANWGANLKGSPEFENFLQYVKDTSPGVAEFLGDLASSALDVAKATAPLSTTAMELLTPLLDGISWVAENAPWAIQILWGLYAVTKAIRIGMALFAGAVFLYEVAVAGATLVTEGWAAAIWATGIPEVIAAIVIAVGLLVLGILWLWNNVDWFRNGILGAWEGIKVASIFLWEKVLKPAFDGIWWAIKKVGDIAVWLWKTALVPAFKGIWLVVRIIVAALITLVLAPLWLGIQAIGAISVWLWKNAIKPSFDGIAWLGKWLWNTVLKPTFNAIWGAIKWVGDQFVWLYNHAVRPSANWVADKAKWLWAKGLKPILEFIWDKLKWVGNQFKWLYDHAVRPVSNFIADKAEWLYNKGLKPVFSRIRSAVKLVGDAFGLARDAIKKSWNQVSDIAKKPVNFIIKWVYTKGIKAVWDRVASFVGLGKLPAAPKLLAQGGTVGDGWGPAVPMRTNKPTAIVGEGNPRYPEYVIPTDPKYRGRAKALHAAAGTQLLESGGVLGGAWDWTKDTVSDVIGKGIDWAKTGLDLISDPSKVWSKLTRPILSKVTDGVGKSPMGKALAKYPTKMVSGLGTKIKNAAEALFASGGGGGGAWIKPVNVPYGTRFGVAGHMWSSGHHTGLDFPAATGTPVRAVAGGRVSQATSGGPYGNHILIDHGAGLQSLYAHLSRIRTTVPKATNAGDRIGDVGATGNVTGPHLHLEARLNGRAVDPMKYLTGGGGFNANAVGAAQRYAKSILGNYGWGPSQFGPLQKLWNGESGWRWNARNASSGAYGIPQALPASKMASAGSDWLTNYKTQVRWGLGYIKGRPDYGSPAAAYSKWLARSPHWYDDGGYLQPGLSLVANGTGKPEPVFTSGQWDTLRSATGGGATEVRVDAHVYVGDREITDIVRTEITAHDAKTGASLTAGRYT